MNTGLMFSSKRTNWKTPQAVYDSLNKEFNFDFDPSPVDPTFNGLIIEWGQRNFCNPPYRRILPRFVQKAYEETKKEKFSVLLIPARTDTRYFHKYIFPFCGGVGIKEDVVWAAGIIDEEGCIRIQRKLPADNNHLKSSSCSLMLKVKMTHFPTIQKLQDIFRCGNLYKEKKSENRTKDIWYWSVYGQDAYNILRQIYPFCITKEKEIFFALEWAAAPKPGRKSGMKQLSASNIERDNKYYWLLRKLKQSDIAVHPVHTQIRFIQGRLHFDEYKTGAPFPSCIIIFNTRQTNATSAELRKRRN